VVEPYGGMTDAGADSRANYLLKWEAIRSSKERGATSYDLWGLATGGIAHFKTGFGGREVRYIGAWDLVLDPLGRRVYESAQGGRVWWARRRRGLDTGANAAAFGGTDAG
jgi:lipid II:glycine glycyltransferase (peptidoglycan interpeptide bridge formation enzyme)